MNEINESQAEDGYLAYAYDLVATPEEGGYCTASIPDVSSEASAIEAISIAGVIADDIHHIWKEWSVGGIWYCRVIWQRENARALGGIANTIVGKVYRVYKEELFLG